MVKCARCQDEIPLRERVAYGYRCEDCYSTMCIYIMRSARRVRNVLTNKEVCHTRFFKQPKRGVRKARY